MSSFEVIVACTSQGGIGKDGKIPWHIPSDMRRFRALTTATSEKHMQNAVIMGRKTWESIGSKPLPKRNNIIVTRSGVCHPDAIAVPSLDEALEWCKTSPSIERAFVIGGQSLYEEAIRHEKCTGVLLTLVRGFYDCDVFFPLEEASKRFSTHRVVEEDEDAIYSFMTSTIPRDSSPAVRMHEDHHQ